MKRKFLITLIAFFSIGTVISFTILITDSMYDKNGVQKLNTEASADWPVYDYNQMIDTNSDLIAFITVESIQDKELTGNENIDSLNAKISKLNIDDVLYNRSSNIEKTIKLDQALDFVEPGQSYLMFLSKNEGYYYVTDGNSVIPEKDNMYEVEVPGIEGKYDKIQFINKLEGKEND